MTEEALVEKKPEKTEWNCGQIAGMDIQMAFSYYRFC